MSRQILWYTFVLVAVFLVLTRAGAANQLLRSAGSVYAQSVGVLQGRVVTLGGSSQRVGAIAR